jgi:peptidoglycan/xylan/chitin deacetylase (PgdA/CDA1 family)
MALRVAISFDAEHPDRPCRPGIQESILDVLDTEGVRATFFIQGRWAEAYPRTAALIPQAGHLVGNHSHYHARMPLFSDEGLQADVRSAEVAIREATGVDPRPWFRCPFGVGGDDPRVIAGIQKAGYHPPVGWDVEAMDWEAPSGAAVEAAIIDGVLARGDGAIVLLHTWPDPTLDALPAIVHRLRDAGAEFVPVDQLPVTDGPPRVGGA